MTNPKTATEAQQLLAQLSEKREGLIAALTSSAERRKAQAVAAELGDKAAERELRYIAAEEVQNKAALANVNLVVDEMQRLHDELYAAESKAAAEEKASEEAEAVSADIGELLQVDDELDDLMERARGLLERRKQLCQNPRIVAARMRRRGSMISDRQIGLTILQYFAEYTRAVARMNLAYEEIQRFAEMDGLELGQTSRLVQQRGPRALTISERALLKSRSDIGLPPAGIDPRGWPDAPPRPLDPGLFYSGRDDAGGSPIYSRRKPDGAGGARREVL